MKQLFANSPLIAILAFLLVATACDRQDEYDASGHFEADEVIVSAQQTGEILSFLAREGDRLEAGYIVGQIDVTLSRLQKEQIEASIKALKQKTSRSEERRVGKECVRTYRSRGSRYN